MAKLRDHVLGLRNVALQIYVQCTTMDEILAKLQVDQLVTAAVAASTQGGVVDFERACASAGIISPMTAKAATAGGLAAFDISFTINYPI